MSSAPSSTRTGGRGEDTPHVFAEPAVGIAEIVFIRNPRLTRIPLTDLDALIWSRARDARHVMFSPSYLASAQR